MSFGVCTRIYQLFLSSLCNESGASIMLAGILQMQSRRVKHRGQHSSNASLMQYCITDSVAKWKYLLKSEEEKDEEEAYHRWQAGVIPLSVSQCSEHVGEWKPLQWWWSSLVLPNLTDTSAFWFWWRESKKHKKVAVNLMPIPETPGGNTACIGPQSYHVQWKSRRHRHRHRKNIQTLHKQQPDLRIKFLTAPLCPRPPSLYSYQVQWVLTVSPLYNTARILQNEMPFL